MPGNPVYLSERGAGPGQTNTAGRDLLRRLGVPVTDAGEIAAGTDTALAYEVLATNLTNEDRKRQMLGVADYALSVGLTTVMDMSGTVPGVGFIDQTDGYDFFLELVREGSHKVRTRIYFPGLDEDANLTQLMGYLDNKWPDYGPEMAKIVGIGEWSVGRSLFNEQPLGEAARLAQRRIAERGWTYHQHMHTPEEIDAHLDVWEELSGEFDLAAMRWTPGHLSFITPELIERAKALGLGLGVHGQRYHAGGMGGPPWRTAVESGLVAVGAGSDGARINTLNPWCMIYYMVTGLDVSGELINDGQQITRQQAVKLYASPQQGWFTKEDGLLGGIAVGRFADLAVLEADIFDPAAVPDDQIHHMTSVLTVVGGEVVHDAGVACAVISACPDGGTDFRAKKPVKKALLGPATHPARAARRRRRPAACPEAGKNAPLYWRIAQKRGCPSVPREPTLTPHSSNNPPRTRGGSPGVFHVQHRI